MNREILFRGKRKGCNLWIHGDLVCKKKYCYIYIAGIPKEVEPKTVGQYTGLRDKNGTRIFEGDIVSGHLDDLFPEDESIYKVVWDDYGWHIKNSKGMDTFERGWAKQYFEVIGNIYDNPELMEDYKNNE